METLAQWLKGRCESEHLALRPAAARTGLTPTTINNILKNNKAAPETVRKLARGFSTGTEEGLALEDYLMTLAGYRTPREPPETLVAHAALMDKLKQLGTPQLVMMSYFADYLREVAETSQGLRGNNQEPVVPYRRPREETHGS